MLWTFFFLFNEVKTCTVRRRFVNDHTVYSFRFELVANLFKSLCVTFY